MVFGFVYTGGFAVLLVGCIGYFFACERVRCVVWLELMGVMLSIWFVFRLLGVAFACVGGDCGLWVFCAGLGWVVVFFLIAAIYVLIVVGFVLFAVSGSFVAIGFVT